MKKFQATTIQALYQLCLRQPHEVGASAESQSVPKGTSLNMPEVHEHNSSTKNISINNGNVSVSKGFFSLRVQSWKPHQRDRLLLITIFSFFSLICMSTFVLNVYFYSFLSSILQKFQIYTKGRGKSVRINRCSY